LVWPRVDEKNIGRIGRFEDHDGKTKRGLEAGDSLAKNRSRM
jgi:hypothetical protein